MKYGSAIDLLQNEIRQAVFQNLGSAPSTPKIGQVYFDTVNNVELIYNGTAFYPTDARLRTGIPFSNLSSPTAAFSFGGQVLNNLGTPSVSTDAVNKSYVDTKTLDTFAAPAAPVSFAGFRLTNVGTPSAGTDGTNKSYVDSAVQSAAAGIVSKTAVAVVSVANVTTLSGLPTTDNVTLIDGERILLTAQTTTSQNGPYVVHSGAWARPTTDANGELDLGATWFVERGTQYASSTWRLATPTSGTITPGTTAITITQLTAAVTYTAQNGVQIVGSVISGVAAPSGGLTVGASGFAIDTTVVVRKYAATITGDGVTTSFAVTHSLNTTDIEVTIRDSGGAQIIVDNTASTVNVVTIVFGIAPANAVTYRVIVQG